MAGNSELHAVRRNSVSHNNTRFFDVPTGVDNDLNPIEGYLNCPFESLRKAVKYIEDLVFDVTSHARNAESYCRSPCSDGLTSNQSAAIRLYTMEWVPREHCLYFVLNQTLRNKDRTRLKPWFTYLKLILTGLFQLESVTATVYRGVKLDLRREYPVGKTIIWWAFSSCTDTLSTLESEQFLGKKGVRTIFVIKCSTGKNIANHSRFSNEGEILLLPATKFIVTSSISPAPNFYMIELKEVPSSNILLESPYENIDVPINGQLDHILSAPGQNELDLTNKNLHDRDMATVCKHLRFNNSLVSIDLSSNNITLDGAAYLRNALHTNRTLKILNLSDNKLTDFGVTTLAYGLELNRTLERITLSLNQITDKGVESFVNMLDQNSTIAYVDLSSNEISDEGVRRLVDLLVRRHYLQHLYLHDNKATDNSVQDIIHMLNVNRTLATLYLHGNQFSDDANDRIRSSSLTRDKLALSL
jgi:hypothetical protein